MIKKFKFYVVFGATIIAVVASGMIASGQDLRDLSRAEYAARMQVKGQVRAQSRISKAAGCQPGSASSDLSLNNVRANVHSYGDMWYEKLYTTNYIVPKNQEAGVLSTGGLWLAGTDINGQKKVAALTYRVDGDDWWPGPLSTVNASVSEQTCLDYDQIFEITKPEVLEFLAWKETPEDYTEYSVPDIIVNWPAHGDQSKDEHPFLAPFFDGNGDLKYDPLGSPKNNPDYPWYDLTGSVGCGPNDPTTLFGDQTLWWVFNDAGNAHTESRGQQIGMEIRAQAFCFATNDELNNMTFYNYELHNRSSFVLTDTYFAIFAETDLGGYDDDYIGCHVPRGLAYCYNGDVVDGPLPNYQVYGENPPCVGVDYFEGPFQDDDGLANDIGIGENQALNGIGYGDTIVDNERYGMRRFIYVNFSAGASGYNGPPRQDFEFYNIMRGTWKDQTPMIHGGTGHNNPVLPDDVVTDFAFPGNTDPLNWGTSGITPGSSTSNWTELTGNGGTANSVGDRSSIQSSGPFTLDPGEINDITFGVVWARTTTGDPWHSVELVFLADDKAQRLFDNCFRVLEGPNAPDVEFAELDKELIIFISNSKISNNYKESFSVKDPAILIPDSVVIDNKVYYTPGHRLWKAVRDSAELFENYSVYKFQGYQVYQVRDAAVSVSDLANVELARLAFQCDLKDGVDRLINYDFDEDLGSPVPSLMVDGEDNGIGHSFRVTSDLFAITNKTLVNNKAYYFIVIAYGYNNYKDYDPLDVTALDGQQKPYLASRQTANGAIETQIGIPHKPVSGDVIRSNYGDGPAITRVEGHGNGGNFLNISAETRNLILAEEDGILENLTYEPGSGPLNISVIDPNKVPKGCFTIQLVDTLNDGNLDNAVWKLWMDGTTDTIYSTVPISTPYEQLILEWGLSVSINQVENPGLEKQGANGYIGSSIEFADSSNAWLSGVADEDQGSPFNWIRSGQVLRDLDGVFNGDYPEGLKKEADPLTKMYDPWENFEYVIEGWFAPYHLAAFRGNDGSNNKVTSGPATRFDALHSDYGDEGLQVLSSVDIVITSDKSKWSRCFVLETADDPALIEDYPDTETTITDGDAYKLMPRSAPSVDKNGNPDGTGNGKGWFPGYAVNVETGERLNIMFGESSWLKSENGGDMLWNPTGEISDGFSYKFGGKHYIYVVNSRGKADAGGAFKKEFMTRYDSCNFIGTLFDQFDGGAPAKRAFFRNLMWTAIPIVADQEKFMSTDVTIKIRVQKPYEQYYSGVFEEGSDDAINDNWPMYTFCTDDIYAEEDNADSATAALANITAVPNPYYGFSDYESGGSQTTIRITNLPNRCTVSIYTIDGVMVRRLEKDDDEFTFMDWDLKNLANIPISSGLYIIHVNGYEHGERTLKWFGAMRPFDFSGL
ncbi:MAG: T9SS C-terminal target domain-containing protein [Flavobacteriales bacterium]|nr:T9SS C-terminal target domain-containing protein [Flavobacteriales bacterium]